MTTYALKNTHITRHYFHVDFVALTVVWLRETNQSLLHSQQGLISSSGLKQPCVQIWFGGSQVTEKASKQFCDMKSTWVTFSPQITCTS